MAKWSSDTLLDLLLQYLEDNVDRISVCTSQPTTYAEATTNVGAGGYKLAISSTPTFTGPVDDADLTGRKTTVDEEATMTVDVSGTALHVALAKSTGTVLLYVTTCTSQELVAANTVTIPAWKITVPDPT